MGLTGFDMATEDLKDSSFDNVIITNVIGNDNIIDFPVQGPAFVYDSNVELAMAA